MRYGRGRPYPLRSIRALLELRADGLSYDEVCRLAYSAFRVKVERTTLMRWTHRYLNDSEFREAVNRASRHS